MLEKKVLPKDVLDLKIDAYAQYYGHEKAGAGKDILDVPPERRDAKQFAKNLRTKLIEKQIW